MNILGLFVALLILMPFTISAETCGGVSGLDCCSDLVNIPGEPQTCAVPADNQYTFSLNRFGFEHSDGTITWVGSEETFNAASVSIGAEVGAFLSGTSLVPGTYVAMRPEVHPEFTVDASGKTKTSDGLACSSGGPQTGNLITTMENLGDSIPSCSTSPSADECETSNGFIRIRDTSTGNFTITATTSPTITFKFDVGNGVIMNLTGDNTCIYESMGPLNVSMALTN